MIPGLSAAGTVPSSAGGADSRLKPAAHDFEASLMKEFLEPLRRDALFEDGDREDSGGGSEGTLTSFGAEALARAISERGGFGIAEKIMGEIHNGRNRAGTDPLG